MSSALDPLHTTVIPDSSMVRIVPGSTAKAEALCNAGSGVSFCPPDCQPRGSKVGIGAGPRLKRSHPIGDSRSRHPPVNSAVFAFEHRRISGLVVILNQRLDLSSLQCEEAFRSAARRQPVRDALTAQAQSPDRQLRSSASPASVRVHPGVHLQ